MKKLFTFILLIILVSLLPAQNRVRGTNQALEEGYAPTIEKTNFATIKWEETFDSATPPIAGQLLITNG